jgi:hypothetical protein
MLPGCLQLTLEDAKYHHDTVSASRPSSTYSKTTRLLVTVLPMCISAGTGTSPLTTQDLRRTESLVHCLHGFRRVYWLLTTL